MENKVKLTNTVAETAKHPAKGKVILSDTEFPAFCLRVTPGSKSWIVRQKVNGDNKQRTIGSVKLYTAYEARNLARVIAGELRQGIDRLEAAREEKAAKEDERKEQITLSDALVEYLAARPLAERTISDYKSLMEHELSEVKDSTINDMTKEEAQRLYGRITKERGLARANYALRLVRILCRRTGKGCQDWSGFGWVKLPARRTKLEPQHGKRIWQLLANRKSNSGASYLRALLLTGCRKGELANVKVGDISLKANHLTIPSPKNKEPHTVLMSHQLRSLVEPLCTYDDGASRHKTDNVFPGSGDPRKLLISLHNEIGFAFSPHHFRKLFAKTGNHLGIPLPVIKGCLNHATNSGDITMEAYSHPTEADLRSAWQKIADYYTEEPSE